MKALQLISPATLAVVDIEEPTAGRDEIILEVIATGICGSDIHGFAGDSGRRHVGQVMGHESVGRIRSLGAGVSRKDFRIGSLATFNPVVLPRGEATSYEGREQHHPNRIVIGVDPSWPAAFAEQLAVPSENVVILPDLANPFHGALVEPLAVALNATRRAGVKRGDRVLVIGGGPIGQSCVLAAFLDGASGVVVSEPSDARRALCATLGASTVDGSTGELEDLVDGACDVVIDAVGISSTVSQGLKCVPRGGTLCLVGMGNPMITIPAFEISTGERKVVGSFTYTRDIFVETAQWVMGGEPKVELLISEIIDVEAAPQMFDNLARNQFIPGKVLVQISGGEGSLARNPLS